MRRARLSLIVMIPLLSATLHACRRSESSVATQLSNLSVNPDQRRLWREAAGRGRAPGLLNLEQTNQPVQQRKASTIADHAIQSQAVGPTIPPSVTSAVQVLSIDGFGNDDYSGQAVVSNVDASGERLSLELGPRRTITLQARADGRALGVTRGERVRVEVHVRDGEFRRRQIVAVRATNGSGIARITETGDAPLTVTVPLFDLQATQTAGRTGYTVDVRVGAARGTAIAGQIVRIGEMKVGLLASRAVTGPESKAIEGSPYAIELIAWSSR